MQYGIANANKVYQNYPNANYAQVAYKPEYMYNQLYQNNQYVIGVNQNQLIPVYNYGNATNRVQIQTQQKQKQKENYSNSKKAGENILEHLKEGNINNKPGLKQTIYDKNLEVELTDEEKKYYNSLFNQLNKNNIGKIEAKDAAKLVSNSGLSLEKIREIWLMASPSTDSEDFLEKEEFFVLLRLIALAQNNLPYTVEAIENNNPIPPLPNFGLSHQKIVQTNIFEIPEQNKEYYKKLFYTRKELLSEFLSAKNAIKIWTENNFNKPDGVAIKKVVDCLKPFEQKQFFNLKEFQVASYLLAIRHKVEIPTKLPQNLINFLGRKNITEEQKNSRTISDDKIVVTEKNTFKYPDHKQCVTPSRKQNNEIKSNNNTVLIQSIYKKVNELITKSNTISSKINSAKAQIDAEQVKINKLLTYIEDLQIEQNNIQNELINIKHKLIEPQSDLKKIEIQEISDQKNPAQRKLSFDDFQRKQKLNENNYFANTENINLNNNLNNNNINNNLNNNNNINNNNLIVNENVARQGTSNSPQNQIPVRYSDPPINNNQMETGKYYNNYMERNQDYMNVRNNRPTLSPSKNSEKEAFSQNVNLRNLYQLRMPAQMNPFSNETQIQSGNEYAI